MDNILKKVSAEQIRGFFLNLLFLFIPFSIAGDDFSIIGLYLVTIYLFVKKEEKWEKTHMIYGVGLMIFGAILSSVLSDKPWVSFSYFRNFWRFALPFFVFLALKKRDHFRYLRILLIISSIVGVYAIVQRYTGIDLFRSEALKAQLHKTWQGVWFSVGFFSHHLTYGGVTLILFSLFTPLVFDRLGSWKQRLFFAVGALCNFFGAVFSMGRSIWLGLGAAIGIIFLLHLNLKRFIIFAVAILVGAGSFVYLKKTSPTFLDKTAIGVRMKSISLADNKDRLMMWKAAWNMIKDHPVTGLGPYRSDKMQVYYTEIAKKEKQTFQHHSKVGVHNIYLQNWVDFGLIGIVGYLLWWAILMGSIFVTIKNGSSTTFGEDSLLIGLLAGFIGIMVAGFFENNFRDGEVQTAIFTTMGLALALVYKKRQSNREL